MRRFLAVLLGLAIALLVLAPASAATMGKPAVAALQVALYEHGLYTGTIDGIRGKQTEGAIRKLQRLGHPAVAGIRFVLGPYMGTQMHFEAVRSFLRSHGVRSEAEIAALAYRAGEWPGHLEVRLRDGRVIRAPKFHYNYLIPFFIAGSSLQLADFTNELTDASDHELIQREGREKIKKQILKSIKEHTDMHVEEILFPDVTVQ